MDGGAGGHPLIESMAADTTCSGGAHYKTTPPSLSSSPTSSSDDYHSQLPPARRRQMTSDLDSELPAKRRRMTSDLDDSAGFTFPHHMKERGQSTSGLSSILHPSGRMLPVGIAQPIQSRGGEGGGEGGGGETRDPQPVADWEDKTRPVWKDEGGGEGGESWPLESKPDQLRDEDDEAAVQEVMSQLTTGLTSADSDTTSDDDDDEEDGGMESGQQNSQYRNETPDIMGPNKTPLPSDLVTDELPPGKKHHLFISHSTGDQAAIKTSIVVPLRDSQGLKVVACYHCMEHQSKQYNDKHIERAMSESCVILLSLSPSYLDSQRCQREWRKACEFAVRERATERKRPQVVTAAVGRCSRPDRLRNFLYLDFIDREKREHVLEKLAQAISSAVRELSESAVVQSPAEQGDRESDQAIPTNERDSLQLGALGGCEIGESVEREHQKRLEEEFEADFGGNQFESEQETVQSDPRLADINRGGGGGERKRERKSEEEEVEEGEVSDSSNDDDKPPETDTTADLKQSEKVAQFYNDLARPDADNRDQSPIFYMRNFNNWVKSVLIRSHIQPDFTVLDLCCGKGGDLLKWKEGEIGYLVCVDISESSVEACQGRYSSQRMAGRGKRHPPFGAEFHVADCCSVRLRERYQNSGLSFNIVSCQFSVHYAFESYSRAHMMLRNACENLRPGGVFIGTTIDSNEVMRRLRNADQRNEHGSWFIGNKVFSVTLDPSLDPRETLPLFGAQYNFRLHGVVDLPEFLIHFPLLEEMLKTFEMELILCQNFTNFFSENRYLPHNINLMFKMQAFNRVTATMPSELWEVIGLYLVFVFRKRERHTSYSLHN